MVVHGEVVVMATVVTVGVFGGLVPWLRRRRATKAKNSGPIPESPGRPRFPPPDISCERRTPRPPARHAPPGDAYAKRGWQSTAPDFGEPWSWPQVDGQSVDVMVVCGDVQSEVTMTRRCGRYVIEAK